MSPFKINTLLHIYATAEPFEKEPPALAEALDYFLHNSMIVYKDSRACGYMLTEKGEYYVKMLLSLPIPIQKTSWVIPEYTALED